MILAIPDGYMIEEYFADGADPPPPPDTDEFSLEDDLETTLETTILVL